MSSTADRTRAARRRRASDRLAARTSGLPADLGPTTAVLYTRLSQDRDGTSEGVERQERESRALARRLGLTIVQHYSDNDTSATDGSERPAFEQMIADRPEAIIAWHQDRLLRLTRDLEKVIDLGVDVHFVTSSKGGLDLSTPAGRAVARTVAAWSQYEGEQKVERQVSSNIQAAQRGGWQFSRRPYGYRRAAGRIVQVPEEAAVVRECFERYVAGETYYAIAADLNARGVPTHGTKRGASGDVTEWSMARVRQLLRNSRYAGVVTYYDDPVELEPGYAIQWEPIIGQDVWDAYLATREGRKRKGSWSSATKHLLSGLAACGVCGGRLLARPDRGRTVYACTESWCVSRGAADIDALVVATVLARLADPRIVAGLRKAPDVAPVVEEISRLRRNRENVVGLVADGALSPAEARPRLTDLAAQIDALVRRRDAMRRKSPVTALALARAIPDRWEKLTVLDKRRVITDLGLSVVVNKSYRRGPVAFDPRTVRLVWDGEQAAASDSADAA